MDSETESRPIDVGEMPLEEKQSAYSFTVSPHIHERLERHILILKKLIDRKTTKQGWMIDSIKEKLIKDANNNQLPKATCLNVKIGEKLENEIMQKVEFAKKFRFSYSKKQWLVDAVLEKLDREEMEVKGKLIDLTQTQRDTYKQECEKLQAELDKLKLQLLKNQNSNIRTSD
jgi:hypothetical protein